MTHFLTHCWFNLYKYRIFPPTKPPQIMTLLLPCFNAWFKNKFTYTKRLFLERTDIFYYDQLKLGFISLKHFLPFIQFPRLMFLSPLKTFCMQPFKPTLCILLLTLSMDIANSALLFNYSLIEIARSILFCLLMTTIGLS